MAAITTGEQALLSQLQITATCQLLLRSPMPPGCPAAAIRLQTTPKKQPGAPPSHPHPQTSTQLSSAQEQALTLFYSSYRWVWGAAWLFEGLMGQSLHTEQDLPHAGLLWVPRGCCTQRQTLQHLQRVLMSAANIFLGD